jgi:hypothetical protein
MSESLLVARLKVRTWLNAGKYKAKQQRLRELERMDHLPTTVQVCPMSPCLSILTMDSISDDHDTHEENASSDEAGADERRNADQAGASYGHVNRFALEQENGNLRLMLVDIGSKLKQTCDLMDHQRETTQQLVEQNKIILQQQEDSIKQQKNLVEDFLRLESQLQHVSAMQDPIQQTVSQPWIPRDGVILPNSKSLPTLSEPKTQAASSVPSLLNSASRVSRDAVISPNSKSLSEPKKKAATSAPFLLGKSAGKTATSAPFLLGKSTKRKEAPRNISPLYQSNEKARGFLHDSLMAPPPGNASHYKASKAPVVGGFNGEWYSARPKKRQQDGAEKTISTPRQKVDLWDDSQSQQPNYPYKETERCQAIRKGLQCHDCDTVVAVNHVDTVVFVPMLEASDEGGNESAEE